MKFTELLEKMHYKCIIKFVVTKFKCYKKYFKINLINNPFESLRYLEKKYFFKKEIQYFSPINDFVKKLLNESLNIYSTPLKKKKVLLYKISDRFFKQISTQFTIKFASVWRVSLYFQYCEIKLKTHLFTQTM